MSTTDPIERLKMYMEEEGLSQGQLADRLENTRQYVNLILNRNKPITPAIAVKLEALTNEPVRFWLANGDEKHILSDALKSGDIVAAWRAEGSRLLVDNEIEMGIQAAYLGIDPFRTENLEPASYRLNTADEMLLQHIEGSYNLAENGSIKLQPGQRAALMTEEYLVIPANITAKLYPTTNVIDNTVNMNNGGVVHPGFEGCLYFVLSNFTNHEIKIDKGDRILRIEFTFLPVTPTRRYEGSKQKQTTFPKELVESMTTANDSYKASPIARVEDKLDAMIDEMRLGFGRITQGSDGVTSGRRRH